MLSQSAISRIDDDDLGGLNVFWSRCWLGLSSIVREWSMAGRILEEPARDSGEVGAPDDMVWLADIPAWTTSLGDGGWL
jgi:hypothetical protein